MTNQKHPEPQSAGTLESLSPSHTLRAVIHELRATERPPGEHIEFPEVAWPEASDQPQDMEPTRRPIDRRAAWDDLPIGMIEPEEEPTSGLAPVVFWLVILVAFACVLAEAGGWL